MTTEYLETQTKEELLRIVKERTDKIHRLQQEIVDVAEWRRKSVLELRKQNVTYREIAESMNMSEVTVYKIIRGK
jgi:DNA-directed RNA polymerase specialized sigma24 family protein